MTKILLLFRTKSMLNSLSERLRFENFATYELMSESDAEQLCLNEDIDAMIAARTQARKDKNFARADEIRDLLLEQGIILKDTREGVQWKRA